ncbi:hypothetical protein [Streptacidiphilus sp. EB129]|uniref:hypothetical protein n=1 Tax=Streptacidiphilus sp. EB129 TaxID=3156262 RepID=UPI003519162D
MTRTQPRSTAAPFDLTFGDRALAAARRDLVLGRWRGARDLLRATGGDWDHRTHRMRLLADCPTAIHAVESWRSADPGDPDAVVLCAVIEVMRIFAIVAEANRSIGSPPATDDSLNRVHLDHAVRICLQAAGRHPADPVPWVCLLSLARLYGGGHPHVWRWWCELLTRDPHNREAHHQLLRFLSARWHGSNGEMFNFARDTAASAPPGSPLAVLTQAARAEHYRYRVATEGPTALGLTWHWNHEVAVQELHTTMRRWVAQRGDVEHAQDVADLNLVLHGLVLAGLTDAAREVYSQLGDRPTHSPWSCTGNPQRLFAHWREQLTAVGDQHSSAPAAAG